MKKIFLYLLLILSPYTYGQSPKLVVGIVVDQMRYDYLFRYSEKYGNGGFKRLLNGGFECRNAQYNYLPTFTAPGHASIYTGTTPAVHGIAANDWYDKKAKRTVYCTYDKNVNPVGTASETGKMSPANLDASTMGDELEVATNTKAKVIGIALKDRSAILPAGHAADAAYWLDGPSGSFITSSFYKKNLPGWVNDFNAKKYALNYLKKGWNTLLPLEQYTESIADDNAFEKSPNKKSKPAFPYEYGDAIAKGNYDLVKSSPYGNSITKDFAMAAIEAEGMGSDSICDMLCISFSSTDIVGHSFGPKSVEVEDVYLRLDKDLEELFNFLDTKVGKGNYTLFLTADHGASEVPAYLQSLKINAGYADPLAMAKKLKQGLFKEYGDSLVLAYVNQQVYLNDSIIDLKKLDKFAVEKTCAKILMTVKEVSDVVLSEQMNLQAQADMPFRSLVQRGYHNKRSGDVLVSYYPGYMEHEKTGTTHGTAFSYDTHVPLLFYGKGITLGSTLRTIYITDIASTICQLLNLPYTNGNTGNPIFEAIK